MGKITGNPVGRPRDPRRIHWEKLYPSLTRTKKGHMTLELLDMLDRCKSPEAQRILLGVSR